MRYRHRRVTEESDHTVTSARLRRLWRRHHEYRTFHVGRHTNSCSERLVANMRREAHALGATCEPCDPQCANQFRTWIEAQLDARENDQKNAHANSWRERMQTSVPVVGA